jgi:hypothetical protein
MEWGKDGHALMKDIKRAFDPRNLLNPGMPFPTFVTFSKATASSYERPVVGTEWSRSVAERRSTHSREEPQAYACWYLSSLSRVIGVVVTLGLRQSLTPFGWIGFGVCSTFAGGPVHRMWLL